MLEYFSIMVTVSVAVCNSAERRWLERFDKGFLPTHGPTFSHTAHAVPRIWHLTVFRENEVFGVGVARRGNRITDLEFKLHVAAFRFLIPPLQPDLISSAVNDAANTLRDGGALTSDAGEKLLDTIRKSVPGIGPVLNELVAWAAQQSIPGAVGAQLGVEKDAVATLLEVAGIDRGILTQWTDRGEDASFIDGLPSAGDRSAAPATSTSALPRIDGPEQPSLISIDPPREPAPDTSRYWVNEDQLIQHDHQRFADWIGDDGARVGWRRYSNKTGRQQISVYYANRTPVESTLGVDLLYYHEQHQSFVLIQYKKMTSENGQWLYRPDDGLYKELGRMREVDAACRRIEAERHSGDFRLLPTPCFVKLCESQSLIVDSSEWIKGMYLAREHVDDALDSEEFTGPKGGRLLSYGNVPRYLNSTMFTNLLRDGWIGSRGTATEYIGSLVKESLTTGRAVMFGVHSSNKLPGNGRSKAHGKH